MGGREKVSSIHPEGLTANQEELLDLLFTTKTVGKANARITLPDGTLQLREFQRLMAPIDFAQNDEEFALRRHALGDIEAPLSPYFINLRNLPEALVARIVGILYELDPEEQADFVTGIPTAGVPLAEAFADFVEIPYLGIFDKDGRRIKTKGDLDLNLTVGIAIDDLITDGGAIRDALDAAKSAGSELSVRVLVDREQGGLRRLMSEGYDIKAAFRITQIFPYALRVGHISETQYQRIQEYHTHQEVS